MLNCFFYSTNSVARNIYYYHQSVSDESYLKDTIVAPVPPWLAGAVW